jgi:hypothetical protein
MGRDETITVMPRLRQLQQHSLPLLGIGGSGIIFVLIHLIVHGIGSDGGNSLLLVGTLDKLQLEHDPPRNISKIVDLTFIVRLALEGKVHWEACVDVGTPGAMPMYDHLVGLKMAPGTNVLLQYSLMLAAKLLINIQQYSQMTCHLAARVVDKTI